MDRTCATPRVGPSFRHSSFLSRRTSTSPTSMSRATRSQQATLAHFNFLPQSSSKNSNVSYASSNSRASRDNGEQGGLSGVGDGGTRVEGGETAEGGNGKHPKRPSPIQDDIAVSDTDERVAKRLKSTHPSSVSGPGSVDSSFASEPPSSILSTTTNSSILTEPLSPTTQTQTRPLNIFPRAQVGSSNATILDLTRVPPSPSKGKGKEKLRYTSLDPEESGSTSTPRVKAKTRSLSEDGDGGDDRMAMDGIPSLNINVQSPMTPRPRPPSHEDNSLGISAISTSPLTPLPPTPLPPPHHTHTVDSSRANQHNSASYEEMFVEVKSRDGDRDNEDEGARTPRSKTPTPTTSSHALSNGASTSRIPHSQPRPPSQSQSQTLPPSRSSTALVAVTAKRGIVNRMKPKVPSGSTPTSTSSTTPATSSVGVRGRSESTSTVGATGRARSKTPARTLSGPGTSATGDVRGPKTPGRKEREESTSLGLKIPGRKEREDGSGRKEREREEGWKTPGRSTPASVSTSAVTPGRERGRSEMTVPITGVSAKTPGRTTSTMDGSKTPGRTTSTVDGSKTPSQRGRSELPIPIPVPIPVPVQGSNMKTPGRGRTEVSQSRVPRPKTPSASTRSQSRPRAERGDGGQSTSVGTSASALVGSGVPRTPGRASSIPRAKTPRVSEMKATVEMDSSGLRRVEGETTGAEGDAAGESSLFYVVLRAECIALRPYS